METEDMNKYSDEHVTATIEAIVAEYGEDFNYKEQVSSTCWYISVEGEPMCLIGHVLKRLDDRAWTHLKRSVCRIGEDITDDDKNKAYLNGQILSALGDSGWTDLSRSQIEWLRAAQWAQDRGNTWGAALAAYHARKNGGDSPWIV